MKKGGRGKGRRGKKRKRSTNEDPASSVPKNFVTNEMSLKNSLKSPEVHSPVFVETVRQLHPLKRCAYDLIALCLESGVPQNWHERHGSQPCEACQTGCPRSSGWGEVSSLADCRFAAVP